jgi:hypothetical protein
LFRTSGNLNLLDPYRFIQTCTGIAFIVFWCFNFLLVSCSAGGLVTAVAPVLIQAKGIWVGWPGLLDDINEPIPESDPSDKTLTAGLLSEKVRYMNWPSDTFVSISVYVITILLYSYSCGN